MESTSAQRPGRRPRAGRPKMQDDAVPEDGDDVALRRARMRQAQRTYRVKKEDALNAAKEKSAKLEVALRGMLDSFKAFHENLVQSPGTVPADVALQLSKTALEIASFSHKSGLQPHVPKPQHQRHGISGNNTDSEREVSSDPKAASLIVAERFVRASTQRTTEMLTAGSHATCFSPALLQHLNIRSDEVILAQTLGQLSETSSSLLQDIPYAAPVARALPRLFRQVEGGDPSQVVPRLPPPHLQRLKYGHTRTLVETEVEVLLGEWLEAVDVEEYLSERGISVREGSDGSAFINLQVESTSEPSPAASKVMSTDTDPSSDSGHSNDGGTWTRPYTMYPDWQDPSYLAPSDLTAAEPFASDWSIFGKQHHQLHVVPSGIRTFTPLPAFWGQDEHFDDPLMNSSVPQLELDIEQEPLHTHSKITINMDKLIEGLASRTMCLGSSPGIKRESIDEAIREAVVQPDYA